MSIELFTSKSLLQRSYQDPRIKRAIPKRHLATFPDGTLVFRYTADAFTNYHGCSIPTEFRIVQYQLGEFREEPRPQYETVGKLTGLVERDEEPAEAKPYSGKVYEFSDFRFRDPAKLVYGILYESTNSAIPSMDSPELQTNYLGLLRKNGHKVKGFYG